MKNARLSLKIKNKSRQQKSFKKRNFKVNASMFIIVIKNTICPPPKKSHMSAGLFSFRMKPTGTASQDKHSLCWVTTSSIGLTGPDLSAGRPGAPAFGLWEPTVMGMCAEREGFQDTRVRETPGGREINSAAWERLRGKRQEAELGKTVPKKGWVGQDRKQSSGTPPCVGPALRSPMQPYTALRSQPLEFKVERRTGQHGRWGGGEESVLEGRASTSFLFLPKETEKKNHPTNIKGMHAFGCILLEEALVPLTWDQICGSALAQLSKDKSTVYPSERLC